MPIDRIRTVLVIAMLFGALVCRAEEQPDHEARFARAVEDYSRALEEEDRDARLAGFARAEQGFASLVEDGIETAALHTNLGNAALQAQHPGRAVLAYHRALRLDPGAATPSQNLAHIRARLPSWVPRPDAAESAGPIGFYRRFSTGDRSLAASLAFALGCGCLLLSLRRREGAWRGLAILAAIVWLALVASVVVAARDRVDRLAVITTAETDARSADSMLSPLALPDPLPAGVEVRLLEERPDWVRVRLANGRDVWVRASAVTTVAD